MERYTELKAINRMLLGIKRSPVATLDGLTTYTEAALAQSVLDAKRLEILSGHWNFNRRKLTLVPTVDNELYAPGDTIDIYTAEGEDSLIVREDNKIYNVTDDTAEFTDEVEVTCVLSFAYDELPAVIQMVILHEARYEFITEMGRMTPPLERTIGKSIKDANAKLKAWDLRQHRQTIRKDNQSLILADPNWSRGE